MSNLEGVFSISRAYRIKKMKLKVGNLAEPPFFGRLPSTLSSSIHNNISTPPSAVVLLRFVLSLFQDHI